MNLDSTRIKLLLKNLLDNALRHTASGAAVPSLRLRRDDHAVIITVQDFGDGISAEHIPLLTEPFYRPDASRQRGTGGYGLGLYLCRVIIEAHQGQLSISSALGQGTAVMVKLPLDDGS